MIGQEIIGQEVFVYFNFHKKCLSIRARKGPNRGRVIARSNYVLLADASGKVSEAGRQRVLREKRKNVHAGIVGTLVSLSEQPLADSGDGITYDPYKYESFVYVADKSPYAASGAVYMDTSGKPNVRAID